MFSQLSLHLYRWLRWIYLLLQNQQASLGVTLVSQKILQGDICVPNFFSGDTRVTFHYSNKVTLILATYFKRHENKIIRTFTEAYNQCNFLSVTKSKSLKERVHSRIKPDFWVFTLFYTWPPRLKGIRLWSQINNHSHWLAVALIIGRNFCPGFPQCRKVGRWDILRRQSKSACISLYLLVY